MPSVQFVQTNISLTRQQRASLQKVMDDTGKSLSEVLRNLIDVAYPELLIGPPRDVKVVDNEINELYKGTTEALFKKFFGNGNK